MIKVQGKYSEAKIFTDNIEEEAINQLRKLCDLPFTDGCKVRIMPDTHLGVGCVILVGVELVHDMKLNIHKQEVLKLLKEKRYSKEPIVIEVTDERAAMERCFMCFSGFERTSRSLGDNKYEIKLNYYTFEEDDVIMKLIALGPFVKVISPQRVIDVVVRKIKKAMEL